MTEARHGLYCNTVTVPTTQQSRALARALGARLDVLGAQAGAGAWALGGAGRQAGRRAGAGARRARRLQAAGAGGTSVLALGAHGAGGSGHAAGRAGSRRAATRTGSRRAGGRHTGALGASGKGATAGAGRTAWALGARPVRTGWASWVLVHPAWFSTWFFSTRYFFLSHQMNTVHYKINFEKKNILNLIKIKSN